jgi:hypothetical protein
MSGAMSELSYQSIRTANQAREAVNIHHTGKKLTRMTDTGPTISTFSASVKCVITYFIEITTNLHV